MKDALERLAEARMEERLARARWFETVDELQDRASPGGIAEEVWESVQQSFADAAHRAVDTAKERPFLTAAGGLALALFAFRRPIATAVRKRLENAEETERPG